MRNFIKKLIVAKSPIHGEAVSQVPAEVIPQGAASLVAQVLQGADPTQLAPQPPATVPPPKKYCWFSMPKMAT